MRIAGLEVRRPGGFRLGPITVEGPDDRPWVLIGPRGAGKTTLLLALAGRIPADRGRIEGPPVEGIAYLPQFPERVLAGRNLAEDLTGTPRPPAAERRRLASVLREVGLPAARISRPARALSAGERRLAALGLLLLSPARDWAIDEPDAGLDELGRARVADLARGRLLRGGRVWVSTHAPRVYAPLRPFCLVLAAGRVAGSGALGEIAGRAELRAVAGTVRSPAARFWTELRAHLSGLPDEPGKTLRNYEAPIPQVHEILMDRQGLD